MVVETHDEWQVAERRYLSETSMAQLRRNEKAAVFTDDRCRRLLTKTEERLDGGGRARPSGLLRGWRSTWCQGRPTMWQAKEAVREIYAHGDTHIALTG